MGRSASQAILHVDEKGRVTLPPQVRRGSLGMFTYKVEKDGTLRLKPVLGLLTSDQAYFWSRRWQKGERDASEDIRKGRVTRVPFRKIKKFLEDL